MNSPFLSYLRICINHPFSGLSLNHNQLFFLSFSQVWCSKSTPQSLKLQVEKKCNHMLDIPATYRLTLDTSDRPKPIIDMKTKVAF